MTKKFKLLLKKESEHYGTILHGVPYESTIPFLFPLRVEMEDLIPSLDSEHIDYFKENYYLCECELTINGNQGQISTTEGA